MSRSSYKFKYFSSLFYRKFINSLTSDLKFKQLTKLSVLKKRKTRKMIVKKMKFTGKLKLKLYKLVIGAITITKRSSIICKYLNTQRFKVHKGLYSSYLKIYHPQVGYKFGEFSLTKKPFNYPIVKKNGKITKRL
jgi:ribosomal protein S19